MTPAYIAAAGFSAKLINMGLAIAQAATQGVETAIAARDIIRRMVAENRDPTPEEWNAVNLAIDHLLDEIKGA